MDLLEFRNELVNEAAEMLDFCKTENRRPNEKEIARFNEIKAEISKIDYQTEMEELTMEFENRMVTVETEILTEEKMFENTLRGIVNTGETTKSGNTVLIPTTIAQKIIDKVREISPVFRMAEHYNVKGTLNIPQVDYTATTGTTLVMSYASEFSTHSSEQYVTKSISLTGYIAMALTKISKSLLNNAQFDIINYVVEHIAKEVALFLDRELLKGTSQKIEGCSGITNSVTTAANTGITANELITIQDSIPDVHQQNACWVMSRSTRTALRQLKDNEGRYLLNPDLRTEFGWSLLGRPVYVSENMDNIGASKIPIIYGDFSGLAVKISEDFNVEVLRELYAAEHAVGVVASLEVDAKVQDQSKLVKVVMPS